MTWTASRTARRGWWTASPTWSTRSASRAEQPDPIVPDRGSIGAPHPNTVTGMTTSVGRYSAVTDTPAAADAADHFAARLAYETDAADVYGDLAKGVDT